MKKFLNYLASLLTVCLLLISLSGCIILPMHKEGLSLYGQSPVVSVSLYDLRESYLNVGSETPQHDPEYAEVLYTPVAVLSDADLESICMELQALSFDQGIIIFPPVAQDPNFDIFGFVLRIGYENGDCELLGLSCRAYRSAGSWHNVTGRFDEDKWDALLHTYFPEIDFETEDDS